MITQTTVRPSVWIGCLACYNTGVLNGRWFPAEDADEVTPEDLHLGLTAHDELWIFDHEGFPRGTGEMSPDTAALWGEVFDEVGEAQWPALLAWVDSGCYVAEGDDLPSVSDFEERYCGCWDSFEDYATQLAEDICLMEGWPEEAKRFFDWDAWIHDQEFDYTIADAPDGGVFIYRLL